MATVSRRRRRADVDVDYVELPPPSARSKKPAAARRSKPVVEDKPEADVLTAEEEYLLKVYKRYSRSDPTAPSPAITEAPSAHKVLLQAHNRSSASLPDPKTAPPSSGAKSATGGRNIVGKSSPADSEIGVGGTSTADDLPKPTDAIAKAKMVLQKRKAAAAGLSFVRAGSAASSGASGLRKAKITKISGTPFSGARLDPVKYPASGLLLRDEYRTFVEVEHEGERVFEPVEPLVRLLKNFGIADRGDGVGGKQLYETLVMRVSVPAHSGSWGINLCPKDHKDFEEIVFHFNPRRRFVAMNNREGNIWGQQEKYILTRWPELFNVSIRVAVQIDRAGFHVAVDGKYCATFSHRMKLPPNGEELVLQVMTKDDYDTNLGLVVHEIWWGHKDTMPGLPGSVVNTAKYEFTDLHASNLPEMLTPVQEEAVRKRLMDMFQPYGAMQVRVLHRDSKNFGFIKFRQHSDAAKALEELSNAEVQGRVMRLSKAAAR